MISTRRLLPLMTGFLLVPLLAACGGEDQGQETATEAACDYPSDGRSPSREVTPPSTDPDRTDEVTVAIETSLGTLKAELDADAAPCTVNSFLSLAAQGYYDDTECHRLTTAGIFVLQCGDPTATGTGGPGYTIPDELERAAKDGYPAGSLAMAKTRDPDSGGSQFFIVYDDSQLAPDYAVFGQIDEAGTESVRAAAAKGTQTGATDGPPAKAVTITSVTTD